MEQMQVQQSCRLLGRLVGAVYITGSSHRGLYRPDRAAQRGAVTRVGHGVPAHVGRAQRCERAARPLQRHAHHHAVGGITGLVQLRYDHLWRRRLHERRAPQPVYGRVCHRAVAAPVDLYLYLVQVEVAAAQLRGGAVGGVVYDLCSASGHSGAEHGS